MSFSRQRKMREMKANRAREDWEISSEWDSIVENFIRQLEDFEKILNVRVEVVQIKEKFGELRIYLDYNSSELGPSGVGYLDGLVDITTRKASQVCERCGKNPAKLRTAGLWLSTLCSGCYENTEKKD